MHDSYWYMWIWNIPYWLYEYMNGGDWLNLLCSPTSNNWCSYSAPAPPKKVEQTSPLLWVTSFQRVQGEKGEEETQQTLPQPDVKVNIKSDKSCGMHVHLIMRWWEWALYLGVFLPETDRPTLIVRKHQTDPNVGTSYKMPDQYSRHLSGSSNTRKIGETASAKKSLKGTWQPSVMVSWMES